MIKGKHYDYIIIGAGPAGSMLANKLQGKCNLLLVDKRPLDSDEIKNNKNCGGLIAPDAQKVLSELGLSIPKDVLAYQQMFSVETIDYDNDLVRTYQRHYINVDREKYDRWLVSLSIDNIDTAFKYSFKGATRTNDGFIVKLVKGNETVEVSCNYLIGADGANSKVRKLLPLQKNEPKRYISIQEHFDNPNELNKMVAIFDAEITDFYSWIIPKDNKLIFGSAIPANSNFSKLHDLQKKKLEKYGYDFTNTTKKESCFILRPYSKNELYKGHENIALIGEAAGLISPTSAEGISYAMKSGDMLGHIVLKGGDFSGYIGTTNKLEKSIQKKMLKYPAMYNKYIRGFILKLGIRSMKVDS